MIGLVRFNWPNAEKQGCFALHPDFEWLGQHQGGEYSQFGEDGILAALVDKYGEGNRKIVECGAYDGREFCNSLQWIERGWGARLIESDPIAYSRLLTRYRYLGGGVHTKRATMTAANVDELLGDTPQIFVLDVDGPELRILAGMRKRPPILMVEYSPYLGDTKQAAREPTCEALEAMGYSPLIMTFCNIIALLRQNI